MIIINHKENTFSVVHPKIKGEEERGYLIEAIVTAIRWNSLCDDSVKYNIGRVDATNVFILVELLKSIGSSNLYDKGLTITIKSTSPLETIKRVYMALIAAVRWNSLVGVNDRRSDDNSSLQTIASFMEQMVDLKEIN